MSRIKLMAKNPAHSLIVGLDGPTGFFVQVYSTLRTDFPPGPDGDFAFDEQIPFIDKDMGPRWSSEGKPLRPLARHVIITTAKEYADPTDPRTNHAITLMVGDLDPALVDNPLAT